MFLTPTLTVDLSAIVANWQTLRAAYTGREVGAVVKADAYGLGAAQVAGALAHAGCHTFFVATLEEGMALRAALPDVRIVVFHGVGEGEALAFFQHRLVPVLNSPAQMERWRVVSAQAREAVSALMLDTGMHRLGLTPREWGALTPEDFEACRISLVMSHLTCASDPEDAHNAQQLAQFRELMARVRLFGHHPADDDKPAPPGATRSRACHAATKTLQQGINIPLSLANSGGMLLGPEYHCDLARPGCALYGIHPFASPPPASGGRQGGGESDLHPSPNLPPQAGGGIVKPVATWEAPILQIHTVDRAGPVGYGATREVTAGTVIATVASGYADGYHRALSNQGYGMFGGYRVPLLGRVTMDMLSFDISQVPEAERYESARITLLGAEPSVDELAARAGTIGYEILTSIGARVQRVYTGGAA